MKKSSLSIKALTNLDKIFKDIDEVLKQDEAQRSKQAQDKAFDHYVTTGEIVPLPAHEPKVIIFDSLAGMGKDSPLGGTPAHLHPTGPIKKFIRSRRR